MPSRRLAKPRKRSRACSVPDAPLVAGDWRVWPRHRASPSRERREARAAGRRRKRKKSTKRLASRKRRAIDISVPPYGSFGDWATPKRSAAELFFISLLLFSHFSSSSLVI